MATARPRRFAAVAALNALIEIEDSDEDVDRQISDGSDDEAEDVEVIHD